MRIQCSSCGSVVTIRKNENGEVNCPHCGVGLLELQSTRDADIERYSDQPRDDETPGHSKSSLLTPIVIIAGLLIVFGLIAAAIMMLVGH
jgi:transcription initiation factor TFIIIB Brf1 subunit/transcription initiation factor TFIIB